MVSPFCIVIPQGFRTVGYQEISHDFFDDVHIVLVLDTLKITHVCGKNYPGCGEFPEKLLKFNKSQ